MHEQMKKVNNKNNTSSSPVNNTEQEQNSNNRNGTTGTPTMVAQFHITRITYRMNLGTNGVHTTTNMSPYLNAYTHQQNHTSVSRTKYRGMAQRVNNNVNEQCTPVVMELQENRMNDLVKCRHMNEQMSSTECINGHQGQNSHSHSNEEQGNGTAITSTEQNSLHGSTSKAMSTVTCITKFSK